jgi:hypothetical protein
MSGRTDGTQRDLVAQVHQEIRERLEALKPLAEEAGRLEAALARWPEAPATSTPQGREAAPVRRKRAAGQGSGKAKPQNGRRAAATGGGKPPSRNSKAGKALAAAKAKEQTP